jgi:hypothetical protein
MKTLLHWSFAVILLLMHSGTSAQPWFQRIDTVPVTISGTPLDNAWAGGMNLCQFSEIDLDFDGIKDLFVFDRSGNRITTYINGGIVNTVDYKHAPQYQSSFPQMHEWALLVDYDCDGKEDIFTRSELGSYIKVYRNTSSSNTLQFTLAAQVVYSTNPPVLPIDLAPEDIPAIADIDNDGDKDIITFDLNGTYLDYHKNQSMELYGTCDSLTFMVKNYCWGYFSEDFNNNSINLNDTCNTNVSNPEYAPDSVNAMRQRHAGSCSVCLDMDGDGDKEILLGDISHTNLVMVYNGGSPTNATMNASEYNFPANSVSVNLNLFPCGFYLDADNDGIKDLLVGPSVENASHNFTSVWFYKNTGTNANPVFTYQQSDFLQEEMIETGEGAYPVFLDYNADGLLDLLIGNFGYYSIPFQGKISLYENTGTITNPEFDLVTRDFASLGSLGLLNIIPAFGDLDGDGDSDMIVGASDGKLHYFLNVAGSGNPVNLVLSQANYQGIDVGGFAAPQIIDVDRDGLRDLLIGEASGNINYYRNTGTVNVPAFTLITSSFGGVDVMIPCCTGYSYPFMFDVNGSYKLFVGSENGYFHYYDNIDGNLSGNFNQVDTAYLDIDEGFRTGLNGADINNDNLMDLVIGTYNGGVALYMGTATSSVKDDALNRLDFDIYPNPTSGQITIRTREVAGEVALTVFNALGQPVLYEQGVKSTSMAHLPGGIYFCKVTVMSKGKLYTGHKKLVLQNR